MANQLVMNADQFQQLLDRIPAAPAPPPNRAGFKRVTPYASADASEWRTWRHNFSIVAASYGWNDLQQRRQAASSLEGRASLATRDIDHLAANLTIVGLLDLYEARLIPAAAGRLARAEFTTARQAVGETMIEWHTRLREMFARAFPARDANADQALIDQFVNHLQDKAIQLWVLGQAPVDYAAALDHAQSHLANLLITGALKEAPRTGLHAINPPMEEVTNAMGRMTTGRGASGNTVMECWHCGAKGHTRADCEDFKKQRDKWRSYFEREQRGGKGGGRGSRWVNGRGRGAGTKGPPKKPGLHAMEERQEDLQGEKDKQEN